MTETSKERAAEMRRAYHKAWRAKNKDKVREYNRRFWEKRAEQQAAQINRTEAEQGK